MSRRVTPKTGVTLNEEDISIRKTENGKLIFTTYRGRTCGMLLQNDRLVSVSVLPDFFHAATNQFNCKVGAIYIGKIKNVVKNINAYFVEIDKGEICFLPFAKAKYAEVLNRNHDGRLLEGDEILVQVERDAQKTKQASVTTYIVLQDRNELEEIKQKALHRTCYSCLKEAPSPLESILNSFLPGEYQEIITDQENIYRKLIEVNYCNCKIRLYQDDLLSLSGVYGLKSKMDIALERRIWLKSGGYLILEPTEALTVIDVNTGKYEAKKDVEDTYYKINLEAAEEIALQLRLRNLSGIIVVDFINMHSKENQHALMDRLKEMVSKDKIKTLVIDMTPLGLVEITRKKINKPLAEYFKNSNESEDKPYSTIRKRHL